MWGPAGKTAARPCVIVDGVRHMQWTLPRPARLGASGPAVNGVALGAWRSPGLGARMRAYVVLATITVLAAVTVLASGCGSSGTAAPAVSLPVPTTGEVTFYLSLPASTAGLDQAAAEASMPGSPAYRHFISPAAAASRFGATDTQIDAIAKSVQSLGLRYAADPTRLFGRVTGSAAQWQAALGTPLTEQAATASNPFITYTLPAKTPAALQPSGTALLLASAQVYDPAAAGTPPVTRERAGSGGRQPLPPSLFRPTPAPRSRPAARLWR